MTGTSSTRPGATRLGARSVLLVGGGALLFGIALVSWLFSQGKSVKAVDPSESTQAYTASQTHFTVEPPKPEVAVEDPLAKQLREMMNEMRRMLGRIGQMETDIAELKNRKPTQTTMVQQPTGQKVVTPKPPASPMLFVSHELKEAPPVSKVPLYTLAPGGYIPCEVETAMNSDVPGHFVAKVTTNVWDTVSGRHLLVPQGSKVLGHDQSNKLIYGSERMDTVSLTLTFPDGRTVDLGQAPVTDQEGVAGLVGDVDHHFMRLLGAVFIGGALKGGMTALQVAAANAAGAGQVASGITSMGSQATTNIVQPYINTRPTIRVFAGQGCNVLLTKPLALQAMWQ